MIKKEILQDLDWDDLAPPPWWMVTRLPPRAPPGLEAALMPDPGPGEVPAAAAVPPPALPEFIELSFGQAPIPVTEASGQHFQDPAPAEPPKLYPPLPDLKDAFFCIRLAPASQPIFAFEWEDPVGSTKQQLIWTPPQGPLLLAAETKEKCWKGTKVLLQLLMEAGYWVSKKAQICKEELKLQVLSLDPSYEGEESIPRRPRKR
ncbi:uncharacterized protein [Odocoileus virginianus]|uniref:Uncharacterized protein n=1 Tax=Odocoileus virginianus TaxID=9874 RepID=A0ABM4GTQ1_ODOVR